MKTDLEVNATEKFQLCLELNKKDSEKERLDKQLCMKEEQIVSGCEEKERLAKELAMKEEEMVKLAEEKVTVENKA